jgi:hypothetical protein
LNAAISSRMSLISNAWSAACSIVTVWFNGRGRDFHEVLDELRYPRPGSPAQR